MSASSFSSDDDEVSVLRKVSLSLGLSMRRRARVFACDDGGGCALLASGVSLVLEGGDANEALATLDGDLA